MATIYISDLDGTLLDDKGFVSDTTKEKLTMLLKKGVPITFASARDIYSIRAALRGVEVTLPVIEANGSYITEFSTGNKLMINPIRNKELHKIYVAIKYRKMPIISRVYRDSQERFVVSEGYFSKGYHSFVRFQKEVVGERMIVTKDPTSVLLESQVVTLSSLGKAEDVVGLYEDLKALGYEDLDIHYMDSGIGEEYFLSITDEKSNKGYAVDKLRKNFLQEKDLVVCFGDNYNDLRMLQMADIGICVENGHEKLKEVADEIIGKNTEDSVVRYIERKENEFSR